MPAGTLAQTLFAVALVVCLAAVCGAVARRLGQPAVIGEIVAGIALGPSLIGAVVVGGDPLTEVLFPPAVRTQLTALATFGLLVFMFMIGLELDLRRVRTQGRTAVAISLTSVAVPLTLGAGLALFLYEAHGQQAPRPAFVLFLGVAMAITAFPVLARILVDRNLDGTPLGSLVLSCAAVDDVLAWSLLALASTLAGGEDSALGTALGAAAFLVVTVLVTRRLAAWIVRRHRTAGELTPGVFVAVLAGVLLSAFATELIGIHAIFGAFAFGAAFPRQDAEEFVRDLTSRLHDLSVLVLLPVFFVTTGLSVDVGALSAAELLLVPVVIGLACAGKFGAAYGAARTLRIPHRDAAAIGVLMNTRGLTELVALNVGLQIGVLDQSLFTVFVIMALVTTAMAAPLLGRVRPDADPVPAPEPALAGAPRDSGA